MNAPPPAPLTAARPDRAIAIFVAAQIVIWTAVPLLLGTSLPLDVVSDGLGWGHEWQWGYFKHPPLPSWISEAFFDALGDVGPYLASQLAVGATYVFVYLIGREMMAPRAALVATLLLAGVYYFSIPTPEFNHNVAQMPVWAWASFAYLKAIKTGRWRWWGMLGLAAGAAVLVKYASAVLFIAMLIHLLSTRKTAAAFLTLGPTIALVVMAAVIAPHVAWLVQNHFPTFGYAEARAGHAAGVLHRIVDPFKFLLSQLAALLPCLLVAFLIGLLGRTPQRERFVEDEDFRFLVFLGLGPALLTALLSLVTGYGVRDMWGAPMWNLTGLLLVSAMGTRVEAVSLRRLFALTAALLLIMPLAYAIATQWGPEWLGKPSRTQWPDRALASTFSSAWEQETHAPLTIVASDGWLGGLLAMRLQPRPSIFIDGNFRHAPWITPERLAREGALVVWQARDRDSPPAELDLPGMRMMGVKIFAWPKEPRVKPLRIGWGIIAPEKK